MKATGPKLVFIKAVCWLGIAADALWTVGLLVPQVFGLLTGTPDFNPDLQTRLIMGVGGSLMAGWTLLLVWALGDPIGRRGVLLLTAFPVVFGLFAVALTGFLNGDSGNIWILVKTAAIFIAMLSGYLVAARMDRALDNATAESRP